MKILEIVSTLSPGGAERFVVDLSNELSKHCDTTLLTLFDDCKGVRSFYRNEICELVRYKNLGLSDHFSFKKAYKIYKTIKKEKPDIVHIHGFLVPYYCIIALLLYSQKTHFFQTIHNNIASGYSNLFYQFLVKVLGYSNRMRFIALSETNYKDLIQCYPKINAKCIVNGRAPIIPSSRYNDVVSEMKGYKKDKNTKLFLHIARFDKQKNQSLLISGFNRIVNKGFNVDLVIIGNGFDSPLADELRKQACSRIHFIGTRNNVGDYLLNSDFFCLSSLYEGMPISMLEASLAGVPIISTPVCGAVDIIINKKNGLICKDFSIENYALILEEAISLSEELKQGASDMKSDNSYTIKLCADRYYKYFKDSCE